MRHVHAYSRGREARSGDAVTASAKTTRPSSSTTSSVRLLRRSFLAGLGFAAGGLAFGVFESDAQAAGAGLRPNVFVHVASDGKVTLVCHRSEMGQGVRGSIVYLLADELGADMKRVTVVQADGDPVYGDQNTDGSTSIRNGYEKLRQVAATGRTMLVATAAKRWKVAPATCIAKDHAVTHPPSKRSFSFGELADDAGKLPIPKPEHVKLRPTSELSTLSAANLPLLDGKAFVMGTAVFGADVRVPDMLIAVIARPPVVGGKVSKFDAAKALAIPGVRRVVEVPAPKAPYAFQAWGGVAVVADTTWAAMRGRAALEITWDLGENASYDSIQYREALLKGVRAPAKTVRTVGDVDKAHTSAKTKLSAEYYVPHQCHVPMEPPVALARMNGDGCEVWASTQNPQAARKEAARALGIDESKVTVHVTLLGGGFGRKSKADFVSEAALLAREMKAPVRVQWSREDDLRHDYYHAASAQRLEAGLDDDGKVVSWLHRTSFPPIPSTFTGTSWASDGELGQGVLDVPLAVPNVRAENAEAKAHVRIGWLRSVCNIHHAFAINSFIDEIATARGADTKDVMLEIFGPARVVSLGDLGVSKLSNYGAPLDKHPVDVGRLRHVIERVTALSKWSDRKTSGRALGLAAHRSFLTYTAVVVSVVKDGDKLAVDEAWIVADAGTVVNQERARSQMEGAIQFGMSIALHGGATMKGGATEQATFRDYRIVRIAEVPKALHVEIVKSDGLPGGIGEPGVPPVAPAITNALFALTGNRVRSLPIFTRVERERRSEPRRVR